VSRAPRAVAGSDFIASLIAADFTVGMIDPADLIPAAAIAEALYEIADLFGPRSDRRRPSVHSADYTLGTEASGRTAARGATTGQSPEWAPGQEPSAGRVMLVGQVFTTAPYAPCQGEWIPRRPPEAL